MKGKRRFTIELVLVDQGGGPSDLERDLEIDRKARLRRLDNLDDGDLFEAEKLNWPGDSEGSWILVPLGNDLAICQWDPGDEGLWRLGIAVACLKVVRILRKSDVPSFISSGEQ